MDCCGKDSSTFAQLSNTVLECDYDKNVTNLYKAIENESWGSVKCFFETEKWSYMHFMKDIHSPSEQARTWVTRSDPNGKVRWSQLPLHAGIIFQAPNDVIEKLIELYPLGVRCTDDQQMLPLHLAFRVGADDSVMNLLISTFPEAVVTQNQCGLVPYAINGKESRKDYIEAIQQIAYQVSRNVVLSQEKLSTEKIEKLEDAVGVQTSLVETLQKDNEILENQLSDAKKEINKLKDMCFMMQKTLAFSNRPPVPIRTAGYHPRKTMVQNSESVCTDASLCPTNDSLFQTNESAISSVMLNSIQFRKRSKPSKMNKILEAREDTNEPTRCNAKGRHDHFLRTHLYNKGALKSKPSTPKSKVGGINWCDGTNNAIHEI